MIVINKLTKPGGIRRLDILPDTVIIRTSSGGNYIYRLVDPEGNNHVPVDHKEEVMS